MQWYDWFRLVMSAIAFIAMYFMGRNYFRQRDRYTPKMLDYWWAINVMLMTIGVGSIEQVLRDRGPTWAMSLSFCAVLVCLKACRNPQVVILDDAPKSS